MALLLTQAHVSPGQRVHQLAADGSKAWQLVRRAAQLLFPRRQTQDLVFCEGEAAEVNPGPPKDNQTVPLGDV